MSSSLYVNPFAPLDISFLFSQVRMADIWTFTQTQTNKTSLFMLFNDQLNWYKARNSCVAKGGLLASPGSQAKNGFLKAKLKGLKITKSVWFGAKRFLDGQPISSENKWKFRDGTIAEFTDWTEGH